MPQFLPTILYKGTKGINLLHFTVIGTKVQIGASGTAGWNQCIKEVCKQKIITVENGTFSRIELEDIEETDSALNPVRSFSNSKLYRELWR